MLERIKTLQTARREMDAQQSSLETLQDDTAHLDSKLSPGWTSEIQEKIETIQDKWEALSQIIEVQAQRVCLFDFFFSFHFCSALYISCYYSIIVFILLDMQFWL